MTYQRNIAKPFLLPEQHVLDESLEDDVGGVEEDADDETGNQHHDDALDQLTLSRPLDLLQLAPRFDDEAANAPARQDARLARRFRTIARASSRPPRRRPAGERRLTAGTRLGAARTPLGSRLPRHLTRLPVRGVLAAPAAEFAHLEPVGRVPLRLGAHVVTPLALGASKRDLVSYSSGHFVCVVRGKRTPRQTPGLRGQRSVAGTSTFRPDPPLNREQRREASAG